MKASTPSVNNHGYLGRQGVSGWQGTHLLPALSGLGTALGDEPVLLSPGVMLGAAEGLSRGTARIWRS